MSEYEQLMDEVQQYPDGTRAKAIAQVAHLVDIKKMSQEDPTYFINFVRSLCGGPDNYKNLGYMVEFYNKFKAINPDAGNKFVELINKKKEAVDNYILSLDLSKPRIVDISEFRIETKKRGITSISYEFIDIKNKIAELYGITLRGIYSGVEQEAASEILKTEFGFTDDEIKNAYSISPLEGNICAIIMSVLSNFISEVLVRYLDYWHHLLENDFIELRRGGTNYMSIYSEESPIEENELFSIIRKIFTLECPIDEGEEMIAFHVDW